MWQHGVPYVVIEGRDYAGKSSVISEMVSRLTRPVQVVREPGGTSFGETIRSIVLEQQTEETRLSMTEELTLMMAQRSYLHRKVITPALQEGKMIIADRGEATTYAYQVNHHNDNSFMALHDDMDLRTPDIFFYLDVSYDQYLKRKAGRGVTHKFHDVMDRKLFEYRGRRYEEYMSRMLDKNKTFVFGPQENRSSAEIAEIILKVINAGFSAFGEK